MRKPRSDRSCFSVEQMEERIERVTESGCWIWMGGLKPNGYGETYGRWGSVDALKKNYYPHRIMYQLIRGPIPEGLQLDHLCRVRCCVNPYHLEAVTQAVNLMRGYGPAAVFARRTHCAAGHELTPENSIARTPEWRKYHRECKRCHSRRECDRKARLKALQV